MHCLELPFACSLNERLLDVVINRSAWKGEDPKRLLDDFRSKGAQYMNVLRNEERYIVSFVGSHAFPLLTPEEEEQMIFILSLEN